ncbi:MAG: sporulation protein YtxC [Sedimentibacter saalensis]|uniref:Putative sporulation protein YtxC n=1 Tax=Sedimentibacter saalensis TaxID=130788 RepID=A0A562J623_9FIRM|nr:sporulation protein YtxC [Sedimentibacter saalensis]MEA5096829.1 sporulation protein YtxC [Sedimentibacter saalensis]TWH78616.1 putative sporulation protein YtxC [Sedimentibacter saalensis]
MELLSLELNENENHELFNNIKIITNLDESDINIELSSTDEGNIRVRYFTNEKLNKRELTEKIIAKVTTLLVEYTKLESINCLKENYFYFDEDEVGSIIEDIEDEIDNDIKIKLIIKNKFKEVLERSSTINLNGFINFRLKFIKLYAVQVVERCIDSYLMKKEYLDFISIIKLISDKDEKENELVNIMYNNNKLQVYDKNMQKLTFITNAEFSTELTEKTVLYDEIIINILLSISPKKIIIHEAKIDKKNKEATNTIDVIKKIFENKVEICKGCKYCEFL